MQSWLTTEVILGALVVTSYTTMGLVSLWAATSRRHWFLRLLAVLGALAVLLMVPVCEPVMVFAIQAIIIVGTVWVWRWATGTNTKSSSERSLPSYSLSNFLWGITAAAIVMALAVRLVTHMPPQNFEAWTTILVNGFASGIAVLVGAWLVVARRIVVVWPLAALLCFATTALLIGLDWFGVFYGNYFLNWSWPPDTRIWQMWTLTFAEQKVQWIHALFWMCTLPMIVAATSLLVLLFQLASPHGFIASGSDRSAGNLTARTQGMAAVVFAAMVLLVAAFPAFVMLKLLRPTPIPVVTLPEPNGYDDLVAAGRMIEQRSPMLNTMLEPKSTDELAAEVAKFAAVYDRIRLGLSRPCQAKPWVMKGNSFLGSLALEGMQSLRAAARALSREAGLALQQERIGDAATISMENHRLGHATARGGLVVDYLVGLAIEGIGQATLYPAVSHLDDETCVEIIAELESFDNSREPLDEVIVRDRIWSENAFGWSGHLALLLSEWTGQNTSSEDALNLSQNRYRAMNRLLIVELALRRYELVHGARPKTLDELVPNYLPAIPLDPFDDAGGPLRYVDVDGVMMAYSIGLDREDDGGRASSVDDEFSWYLNGDIRLDVVFAEEDPQQYAADPVDDESGAAFEEER